MSKTNLNSETPYQRRRAVNNRARAGQPLAREHGKNPKNPPNYTLRRLAATATLATLAWNTAEATDYGDKLPVVGEVKDGVELVVDTMITNIDNGPSNPEVINNEWLKYYHDVQENQQLDDTQGPALINHDETN